MSRAPEIPQLQEEIGIITERRLPRLRSVATKLGMVAAGTIVVCAAASPFVYKWIDSLGNELNTQINPMTGKLDEVGDKTGKLADNVETGVPELSDRLGGVQDSIDNITESTTSTTVTSP